MKTRLDKLLAANGFGSRREIKRLLRAKEFTVNGAACYDPSASVDPGTDSFSLDGKPLSLFTSVYIMLNKPQGVVTSTDDPGHRTVMDILDPPWSDMDLFPVGRLDLDTEGLLLLTNDGPLGHRLTSPRTGVDKTYQAKLRDPVDDETLSRYVAQFASGISFRDGFTCLPAKLSRTCGARDNLTVTIQEGKYHQVKKMFLAVGNEVVGLKRISMGPLELDVNLACGEYRLLAGEEIEMLGGNADSGIDE